MGAFADRIRFDSTLPDEGEVLAEFRYRAGDGLLAGLTFRGPAEVHTLTGLGPRARPYLLQILVERGGVLLDYSSGAPSGEVLPAFAKVPWCELPWDVRTAAEQDSVRELFPDEVWAFRLWPRPLEVILLRDPDLGSIAASALGVADGRLLLTLRQSHELAGPAIRALLLRLVGYACNTADRAQQELGRAALREIPIVTLHGTLLSVVRDSVDLSDGARVASLLETLAVAAHHLFVELAEELAQSGVPSAARVATDLLQEARGG